MRSALAAALLCVACSAPAPTKLPTSCAGAHGGATGAQTQLRYIEATDSQVVLTFGPSAEPGGFDVPEFTLEPLEGTSAPRAYRLRVEGASSINPDGTSSYNGLTSIEPGTRTVRAVRLIDRSRRTLLFTVLLEKDTCPFVAARSFVFGKSPRAQIALTFNDAGSLTLEGQADVVGGAEAGTPMQASGTGYAPGSTVTIRLAGNEIQRTTADAGGSFDTGMWVPDRDPEVYVVTADDGHGRVGRTTLRVMARRATH